MLGECCNHRALRQEREQDCFLLPLFYEPSLETRFLLPADTTKLQTVWGQPSCSLQQIILWSIFLKHQPAVDTDNITDHMRWEPQFWVMLRCIFFHRTVFPTAMLWPWSGTEAQRPAQRPEASRGQRPAERTLMGGHMQTSQPWRTESLGELLLLTPQPHTKHPDPRSCTWSRGPSFICT